jgi:hypothetical protein
MDYLDALKPRSHAQASSTKRMAAEFMPYRRPRNYLEFLSRRSCEDPLETDGFFESTPPQKPTGVN